MRYALLCLVASVSLSAFADDGCRSIHDADPVSISVAARNGNTSIATYDMLVAGNRHSPVQPAVRLVFKAGDFAFDVVPTASCHHGIRLELHLAPTPSEAFVPWGQESVVAGAAGTDEFIAVTVRQVKP